MTTLATDLGKIFANHIANKEPVSRTYIILLQMNKKTTQFKNGQEN